MILSRRVLSALWVLFLLSTPGADAESVAHPPEPEIISVVPLAGQHGTALDAESRGKNLQDAHALWADHDGIQADITSVERVDLRDKDATGRQKKEKEQGYRVSLQIKTDATVEAGLYSLRLVSPAGISNAVPFRVTADPIIYETNESPIDESRTLDALRDTLLPKLISGEAQNDNVERFLKGNAT